MWGSGTGVRSLDCMCERAPRRRGEDNESSLSLMELEKGALGTVKGECQVGSGGMGGLRAEKRVWVGGAVSMKAPKALGGMAGAEGKERQDSLLLNLPGVVRNASPSLQPDPWRPFPGAGLGLAFSQAFWVTVSWTVLGTTWATAILKT